MNNSYFEDLEKRVDSEAEAEVRGVEAQFRAGKARNNLEGLQDNPPLNSSSLGIRHFRFLCFFFSSHFTVKNSGHFRERPSRKLQTAHSHSLHTWPFVRRKQYLRRSEMKNMFKCCIALFRIVLLN